MMGKKHKAAPWMSEPEECDFEHAGLKCAMRRGPYDAWCGYVAVPKTHPWFGKHYYGVVDVPQETVDRVINLLCDAGEADEIKSGHMEVVLAIDVHGGITYSKDRVPLDKPDAVH